SSGMLKQDVRGGYLPHPERRGRRPGQWEPWAARRAVYLYRLRKLGLRGDLLRVFLFLRDGQMWPGVRPIAEKGTRKLIHATLIPARPRWSNRKSLPYDAEDFSLGARIGTTPVGIRPEMAKYIWGVLLYGQPAKGGTMVPAFLRTMCALGIQFDETAAHLVEEATTQLGATADRVIAVVEEADERSADPARRSLRRVVYLLRRLVRKYMKRELVGPRSSSPLGGFGIPPEQWASTLREFPGKLTPAQLLAA